MQERKIQRKVAFLGIATALALTGCGSSSAENDSYDTGAARAYTETAGAGNYKSAGNADMALEAAAEEPAAGNYAVTEDGSFTGENQNGAGEALSEEASGTNQNRKLIREVSLSLETKEFDGLLEGIESRVKELGGYIENSEIYCDSYDWYGENTAKQNRNSSLTVRVPSEKLDTFLDEVSEMTNVLYRSENVRDVTLNYVDLESHKKALLTEQESLLSLMEKAEAVEDIISIESRLAEVRYQLESMESQLRTLDNQVDYSTVYLNIQEVARMTPVQQDESVWEKIRVGFLENVYRVGTGIRDAAVEFLIALPVIFAWAVILGILAAVLFFVWKRIRRKDRKNATGKQKQVPEAEKETETEHGNGK